MSGFDENPFGEPNVNNDPFADPAVRKAASSVPNSGIDDYNPFANQTGATGPQVRGATNPPIYGGTANQPNQTPSYGGTAVTAQQPAMLQTSSQEAPPPNYTRTPQQNIPQSSSGSFSPTSQPPNEPWRRNTQDMSNAPYYPRRNNWPPVPESCCVQPCFYQDIDVEIQPDFQKIVRQLYYLWIFHAGVLLLNVVVGFILLLADDREDNFTVFGLGLVYLILFTPFSFLCWFRPVYQAFKNDSSFNFMVFFLIFSFQAFITLFHFIGFPSSGTCGIIRVLMTFSTKPKGLILGILVLVTAVGFLTAAVADIVLISKVHRIYRNTGASVSKAQQEFTSNFLRNEHVQTATANIAASAVRNQVNTMTQQPRY
ncbi:secretory carrier-associated membrane protein 5 [Copidosoma floridanum]|uniref:secretory carrier-associated membrane protein 5 n=1 Tax=Copidosoma floridanum TaxID=29053 RepID=UPI0006C9C76F|nr:secretory carrier-associated membrane protein 5 [Copidosoma floridanum]XP_023246255.1 secretory carrier-associated membrane protein 5 [Copidosoma floridanum]